MGFREAAWGVVGAVLVTLAGAARAEPAGAAAVPSVYSPFKIPFDDLPPAARARVRAVVERPTLRAQGPIEVFACQPAVYRWLLDHPDVGVRLWRALGAQCSEIHAEAQGRFAWRDDQGGRVVWETVLRSPGQRVWYAEGQVKPALLLPPVSVRAVVVLNHTDGHDRAGRPAVRHQAELVLQTDSQAVALAARLLGASAPRLAEQYAGQLETFFAALAWYLDQEPERARQLLAQALAPTKEAAAATSERRPTPPPAP